MTEAVIKTLPGKNVGSLSRARLNSRLPFPELAQIPLNGLQFWVDAGNPRSYGGTGTTWSDLSGNGYDLTMQNSGNITFNSLGYFTLTSTGYFSRATGNTNIPDANDNYTMLAWVRNSDWGNSPYGRGIMSIGGFNTNFRSNALRTDYSSVGAFYNYWWANDLLVAGANTFARTNCWYMVNCSFDGTTRRIHTNTIQAASDTPTNNHNVTSTALQVGLTYITTNEYLVGDVAVAMIYDRAINNSEMVQIYNTYRNRFGV